MPILGLKGLNVQKKVFMIVLYSPSQIYFWGQSRAVTAKRRRRAVPSYAAFVNVPGGNTQSYKVTKLKPYTHYSIAIKAFNSGGEGPASTEVFADTDEAGKLRPFFLVPPTWNLRFKHLLLNLNLRWNSTEYIY